MLVDPRMVTRFSLRRPTWCSSAPHINIFPCDVRWFTISIDDNFPFRIVLFACHAHPPRVLSYDIPAWLWKRMQWKNFIPVHCHRHLHARVQNSKNVSSLSLPARRLVMGECCQLNQKKGNGVDLLNFQSPLSAEVWCVTSSPSAHVSAKRWQSRNSRSSFSFHPTSNRPSTPNSPYDPIPAIPWWKPIGSFLFLAVNTLLELTGSVSDWWNEVDVNCLCNRCDNWWGGWQF